MTDFERDVIDRLARIEENAKAGSNLASTVLAQGLRLDALEDRLNRFRDRSWGVLGLAIFIGVPVIAFLRNHLFAYIGSLIDVAK